MTELSKLTRSTNSRTKTSREGTARQISFYDIFVSDQRVEGTTLGNNVTAGFILLFILFCHVNNGWD